MSYPRQNSDHQAGTRIGDRSAVNEIEDPVCCQRNHHQRFKNDGARGRSHDREQPNPWSTSRCSFPDCKAAAREKASGT